MVQGGGVVRWMGLILLAACGRAPGGAPSLEVWMAELLPEGAHAAQAFDVGLPEPFAAWASQLEQATERDLAELMAAPPPYDPSFGIDATQYGQLQSAWEHGQWALLSLGAYVVEFGRNGSLTRLVAGDELTILNEFEFHSDRDLVRTLWGELAGSVPITIEGGHYLTADGSRFVGRQWLASEGNWKSALADPAGSARELRVLLGRAGPDATPTLVARIASRQRGVTYVDAEVVVQWEPAE